MLGEFLTCKSPIDDISPCNYFLGRALMRVYGVNDFSTGADTYMRAAAIAAYVADSDKWTRLGEATDQSALRSAQGYANLGKPVIAVTSSHVALVIPGDLVMSGNWNLKAPNSASFFIDEPAKSFVGKPLSYAFTSPANVQIYGRNF
jgi:hypothetical protein